jgi:hypothetical protein
MITTDKNLKKIEAITQMCRAAISQQVERGTKGGFGLDDYTDGRRVVRRYSSRRSKTRELLWISFRSSSRPTRAPKA